MNFNELTAQYAGLLAGAEEQNGRWVLTCVAENLHPLLEVLRPHFDYPEDLTCVDDQETLRVFYRLYDTATKQQALVQVHVARTGAHLPTAVDLWLGFDWQEREAFDLFGVVFDGHPDLRRILTWEGIQGHPLLKDFIVDNDDSSWQIPEQTDAEILALLQQLPGNEQ